MAGFLLGLDASSRLNIPLLDPLHRQVHYAPGLRMLLTYLVNREPDYLPRLQRHYAQFRACCDGRPYAGAPFATAETVESAAVSVLPLPPRPAAAAPDPAPPDPAAAQALEEEARALVESALAWERDHAHLGRDRGSWDHLIPQSLATGRNLTLPLLHPGRPPPGRLRRGPAIEPGGPAPADRAAQLAARRGAAGGGCTDQGGAQGRGGRCATAAG